MLRWLLSTRTRFGVHGTAFAEHLTPPRGTLRLSINASPRRQPALLAPRRLSFDPNRTTVAVQGHHTAPGKPIPVPPTTVLRPESIAVAAK